VLSLQPNRKDNSGGPIRTHHLPAAVRKTLWGFHGRAFLSVNPAPLFTSLSRSNLVCTKNGAGVDGGHASRSHSVHNLCDLLQRRFRTTFSSAGLRWGREVLRSPLSSDWRVPISFQMLPTPSRKPSKGTDASPGALSLHQHGKTGSTLLATSPECAHRDQPAGVLVAGIASVVYPQKWLRVSRERAPSDTAFHDHCSTAMTILPCACCCPK
jgi:hypothetical protein